MHAPKLRKLLNALGVALAALVGPAIPDASAEPLGEAALDDGRVDARRYDEVRQPTAHNAYALAWSLDEQLRRGVRSLEIDAHRSKRWRAPLEDDFFVYHVDLPLFDGSVCARLSSCLDQVAAFHRRAPRHSVLTLFVDVKEPLGDHGADALDALLRARFDEGSLFTPAALMATCQGARDLRDAVGLPRCGWPTVEALRGKVIVALTGGDLCAPGSRLAAYLRGPRTRPAFVAPNVHEGCPSHREAGPLARDAVFFNMDYDHRDEARAVAASHAIGRVYYGGVLGGLDAAWAWNAARAAGAQLLATDRLDWR
jgi:hypothetical protein